MPDQNHPADATDRLLAEIRDLLREQGRRQQQALDVQQRSYELQQQAVATQAVAVRTQRGALRVLIPIVVALVLLVLLWAVLARRG